MHLIADAIVLAVRTHGEHGAVARALTPADGVQAGYVRGGRSRRIGPILAGIHVILYWASISLLTPFILLIALFSNRKRLLHDMLIGAVVMNRAPLEASGR